ncbi:hypothetical protein A7985_14695 [Pseudoalteromonas luteoviolacea]|uniref:Uncharacterized protein n=1 Tax=Pseudoalteromonas luteoviolacea TaxID=43657 RepID=A0A1C0TQ08_9GAMM|nr:type I polyketide synthase [Pseudoalteromonas luteoviolacea]OCQ21029.1 hypothetical protein A7985_14695 [Pseudoalteromonas luteoviolacea]
MKKNMQQKDYTGMEIAVIGMAARFPGASNIDEYWANLSGTIDSIATLTKEELIDCGVPSELVNHNKYVPAKGLISDSDKFDERFFGYTPREAHLMDPQIRLMHQCTWHALEDAGYNSYSYDKRIGIYAGASSNPIWLLSSMLSEHPKVASFVADRDYLCSRVANKLDLKGPAVFIQTACSTSLVSIHIACRALLTGDCEMALAGGVSIKVPNKVGHLHQEGMITSSDGRCRSFDAKADGTVGGEGVGMVLLKPLAKAIQDKDNIHAVIRASAINNDGYEKGSFSAPSITGQADAIKRAHRIGKVPANTLGFLEAHGTGTIIGDPIEVQALHNAFNTTETNICALGSVKSNIGHLDHAAGVAGFIKAVLSLKHKKIPATAHYRSPNPKLNIQSSPFFVNDSLLNWEAPLNHPRRAAVNSLGIGGTNAYVVLEEFDSSKTRTQEEEVQLLLLSAKSASSLKDNKRNLATFIRSHYNDINPADIAYTLQAGRANWDHREAFIFNNTEQLLANLEGEEIDSLTHTIGSSILQESDNSVVFVFPGQGAQYEKMGKELYSEVKIFRELLDPLFEQLKQFSEIDFKAIWLSDSTTKRDIYRTEVAQPLMFVFEYALAKTLIELGIKPDAMLGHSLGEITAAAISGAMKLEHALDLVCIRGRLMQTIASGEMVSVRLSAEEIIPFLQDGVTIAAINSLKSTVIAGQSDKVSEVVKKLELANIALQVLPTSHAFHTPMVDSITSTFAAKIRHIPFSIPQVPYVSNVSGNWINPSSALTPEYWVDHMRRPVQFSAGIETLSTLENPLFLEVGPGSAMSRFIINHDRKWNDRSLTLVVSKHGKANGKEHFTSSLAKLWLNGVDIDWHKCATESAKRISLPGYAFTPTPYPFPKLSINTANRLSPFEIQESATVKPKGNGITSNETMFDTLPLSATQSKIAEIFKRALGLSELELTDDFFTLGGDSLTAIGVIASIHKELSVKLTIAKFFELTSVAKIAEYVDSHEKSAHFVIPKAPMLGSYPLSPAQLRLYIVQQTELDNTGYNETLETYILGNLDRAKLESVFQQLIVRHEALRTSYHVEDANIVQKVHSAVTFNMEYYKASENEIEITLNNFVRPFLLDNAPLFRVALVQVSEEKHLLLMDFHHIIIDGVAMTLLFKEMIALYEDKALPDMECQYKDYALWQNGTQQRQLVAEQESYWLNKFTENPITPLNLPTDYPRPKFRTFEGKRISFKIEKDELNLLKAAVLKEGVSLFMLLIGVYNVLLCKLSAKEDILIGTVVAGRRHESIQSVIGVFINTLVLRNYPKKELAFDSFLQNVKCDCLEAFENQEYQYEDLIEKLGIERDSSHNSLFDVAFVLQNMADGKDTPDKMGDTCFVPYHRDKDTSKFDITLTAFESVHGIQFSWDYSTNLFSEDTINLYTQAYLNILRTIVEDPQILIRDIELMAKADKAQQADLQELEDWVF